MGLSSHFVTFGVDLLLLYLYYLYLPWWLIWSRKIFRLCNFYPIDTTGPVSYWL